MRVLYAGLFASCAPPIRQYGRIGRFVPQPLLAGSACTPVDRDAPDAGRAQLDARGGLKRKPESPTSALDGPAVFVAGEFSADGYSLTNDW